MVLRAYVKGLLQTGVMVSTALIIVTGTLSVTTVSVTAQVAVGGCQVFPGDNYWNVPVDHLPVDPRSETYVTSIGRERNLHPDFGPENAIPINIVPQNQPLVPVSIDEVDESDPGPFPIPPNPLIENGSDQHMLIVREGDCKLFELFDARPAANGGWLAFSTAVFDLNSNRLRPDGWTSADAAGFPILPGLVRWEEIAAGEIRHAIRFTAPRTRRAYVWPARHFASRSDDAALPPMGLRMRLKKDFPIDRYSKEMQIFLTALKKYGIVLADNGSPWFLTGAPNRGWTDDFIAAVKTVPAQAFEAVDTSLLQISYDSGQAKLPTDLNVVSFASRPRFDLTFGPAQSITLTGDVEAPVFFNLVEGKSLTMVICQDENGSRQFNWSSQVKGGMQVGTEANRCSVQSFVVHRGALLATGPGMRDLDPRFP
jgi:hypothetical protein